MFRTFGGWAAAPRRAHTHSETFSNHRTTAQSWGQVKPVVTGFDIEPEHPIAPNSPPAVLTRCLDQEPESVIADVLSSLVDQVVVTNASLNPSDPENAWELALANKGKRNRCVRSRPTVVAPGGAAPLVVSGNTPLPTTVEAVDGGFDAADLPAAIAAVEVLAQAVHAQMKVEASAAKSEPDDGSAHETPAPIVHPVTRPSLFRGWGPWFRQTVEVVRAAEGQAALLAVGTNGERDIPVQPELSWFTRFKYSLSAKHTKYHRASNKLHRRLRVLRVLRDRMIFAGVGHKRVRSDLNIAAAEELARKVIREDLESKESIITCAGDACWFKRALVEVYFVKDDDESFLELLGKSECTPYA